MFVLNCLIYCDFEIVYLILYIYYIIILSGNNFRLIIFKKNKKIWLCRWWCHISQKEYRVIKKCFIIHEITKCF